MVTTPRASRSPRAPLMKKKPEQYNMMYRPKEKTGRSCAADAASAHLPELPRAYFSSRDGELHACVQARVWCMSSTQQISTPMG